MTILICHRSLRCYKTPTSKTLSFSDSVFSRKLRLFPFRRAFFDRSRFVLIAEMPNSVEPQTSTVEDPTEPEILSTAAQKPPENVSSTTENVAPTAAKVEEEKKQPAKEEEKKPAKEVEKKKPAKAPKEKKPRQAKTAAHPPYFQMITEALVALNEKNGSSPYAIAKHMEERHKEVLPANFRKILALQLKNSVARGKLIKIKASFKLADAGKKDKASAKPAKKPPARAKAARETRPSKAMEQKPKPKPKPKAAKKKSTPVKKPKQPKSIKSPAKKKTKKVSA